MIQALVCNNLDRYTTIYLTWYGEMTLLSYVSLFPSKENRNPFLLMLLSDSDFGNILPLPPGSPTDNSLCRLFFLRFLLSLALLELDNSEDVSESLPRAPSSLKSLQAAAAASAYHMKGSTM